VSLRHIFPKHMHAPNTKMLQYKNYIKIKLMTMHYNAHQLFYKRDKVIHALILLHIRDKIHIVIVTRVI